MTILKKLTNFRTINLQALGADAVLDTKFDLLMSNKEQMRDNLDNEGNSLGEYLSPSYKRYKLNRGQIGTVDLLNTGAFQNAMRLDLQSRNAYTITSNDSKTSMLLKKYGKKMFGLNKDSMSEYRSDHFYPDFMPRVKNYLNAE